MLWHSANLVEHTTPLPFGCYMYCVVATQLVQVCQSLTYYQLRLEKLNLHLNTPGYVGGPGASSYRHPSRHKAGCEQRVQVHSELLELFLQPQWR